MKPIAAPIVGGMITSTIHVLILVLVFFFLMNRRALRDGTLARYQDKDGIEQPIAGCSLLILDLSGK
jgi:copper/silver efflux system protein